MWNPVNQRSEKNLFYDFLELLEEDHEFSYSVFFEGVYTDKELSATCQNYHDAKGAVFQRLLEYDYEGMFHDMKEVVKQYIDEKENTCLKIQ